MLPPTERKLSRTTKILMICVTFVGMVLFYMNHVHTSRCSTHASSTQLEESVAALNRRLLQAESQVLFASMFLCNILYSFDIARLTCFRLLGIRCCANLF